MRGCACRGTMGLAHLSCLVWQAEMAVKEKEEWNTGEGMRKWYKCFDCGQDFHGAVQLALGWACWKTYLGRSETDWTRCESLGVLGSALDENRRHEEALPVIEANLALNRRYWPYDVGSILVSQNNLAACLSGNGRHDEALVLKREIYARMVTTFGVSHERAIVSGYNLANSLVGLERRDEATTFLRDQLLPVARRSLGLDHYVTLGINYNLANVLQHGTRDDLRFESQAPISHAAAPRHI